MAVDLDKYIKYPINFRLNTVSGLVLFIGPWDVLNIYCV